jgi:hypothetical protein
MLKQLYGLRVRGSDWGSRHVNEAVGQCFGIDWVDRVDYGVAVAHLNAKLDHGNVEKNYPPSVDGGVLVGSLVDETVAWEMTQKTRPTSHNDVPLMDSPGTDHLYQEVV